jgi:hypothetical protein
VSALLRDSSLPSTWDTTSYAHVSSDTLIRQSSAAQARPSINQPDKVIQFPSGTALFSRICRVFVGLTTVGKGPRESEGVREEEAISISELQGVRRRLFVNGSTWVFHLSSCVYKTAVDKLRRRASFIGARIAPLHTPFWMFLNATFFICYSNAITAGISSTCSPTYESFSTRTGVATEFIEELRSVVLNHSSSVI